jgi:hypothetical protein
MARPSGTFRARRLSSVLTPVFKFGFSATLVAIGIVCMFTCMKQTPGWPGVLGLVTFEVFIAALAYFCVRLKKVTAYCDHLVISNYLSESHVSYEDIGEIEGYRGRSAVFLKVRLRLNCRFGRTIHFLLPSTFAAIESQPEFQLLRERCPRLCKQTHNWWFGSVQLKPHSRHTTK